MQYLPNFTSFVICLILFQFFGCIEDVDITTIIEDIDATPPEIIIFEKLRNDFDGSLENHGDFTGFRNITISQTYLDFLVEMYPTEEPVQTLEEYFQTAPPDAERYTPFLKRWINNPTEEDIALMHRINVNYREANLSVFNATNQSKQQGALSIRLFFEKRIGIMSDSRTKAFIKHYQIPLVEFVEGVEKFVGETENEDAIWLNEQIEKYGIDNGLLWSAIRKPALIGEILQNFSSIDIFLKWVDVTRMQESDD